MATYLRPTQLSDALAALAQGRFTLLAGGTDFYPARVGAAIDEDVLDVTAIASLRGISVQGDTLHIGATTTWTDLIDADLPLWCDGLRLAAREIGGVQIQNAGTVAGNLCNASPAADGVPALLALDARVELANAREGRLVPLAEFITAPRRTVRANDELVAAIVIPRWGDRARSTFVKLGARRYLVISIAMVAVTLEPDAHGRVTRAAIAVGSCSAVAQRLHALEARLVGRAFAAGLGATVQASDFDQLAPITDVRASAEYRGEAALELVRRAIETCVA